MKTMVTMIDIRGSTLYPPPDPRGKKGRANINMINEDFHVVEEPGLRFNLYLPASNQPIFSPITGLSREEAIHHIVEVVKMLVQVGAELYGVTPKEKVLVLMVL